MLVSKTFIVACDAGVRLLFFCLNEARSEASVQWGTPAQMLLKMWLPPLDINFDRWHLPSFWNNVNSFVGKQDAKQSVYWVANFVFCSLLEACKLYNLTWTYLKQVPYSQIIHLESKVWLILDPKIYCKCFYQRR